MVKKFKSNERGISVIDLILLVVIITGLLYIAQYLINSDEEIIIGNNDNKTENIITENNYSITEGNPTANIKEDNDYKRFFYNQLSDNAKEIYNSIISNIDVLKSGQGRIELDIAEEGADSELQPAWDALCLDRVDLFYIDTHKISFVIKTSTNIFGKSSYNYYIEPKNNGNYYLDCWNSSEEVQRAISLVELKTDSIISQIEGKTRYEQIKYIHDYIIENVEYNQTDAINNGNIYGALIEGKAVCEGYAESFKYLMDKLNIPCILVYGNGINNEGDSEYHSWNQVLMEDGNWYSIDTTWDDPILIGYGHLPESSKYKYFLKGSEEFEANHRKESDVSGTGQNFEYVETSEKNYNRK